MNAMARAVAAALEGAPTADPSGEFSGLYRFSPSFPGFDGHFPGDPILPAFVQVMAAVSLARAATRRERHHPDEGRRRCS